jgi:LCP family protein required for cell wall assembly
LARKKHARPAGSEELSLSRNISAEYFSGKLRSRGRKRIVWTVLGALAVIVAGVSIAVASFVTDINTKITGSVDENLKTVLTTQEPGKPFYLLLIGVDKDEGRTNDPSYGAEDSGYRSDSIMLTRIDPGEKKVTMVSIHRDTLVDLGENGQQKINAAYSIGQESYTTQVISEFAGVPISHYAEVDMDGLAAVIDAIGGIDVTLDMDVKDPQYTGIDLAKGTHHLDGHTAALFCRCRHAYDAIGDGDRYRAANQRMVISTVAKKVLSSDPATIATTVSTMASYVRTDMDVQSIVTLAMQFIGMDFENNIYTGMEPTTAKYINETWYELCDTTAWRKMMRRVDQGLPPTEEGDVDALETSPDPSMDTVDVGYTSDTTYDYDSGYDYNYDYNYDTGYDETYYDDGSYDDGSYGDGSYDDGSYDDGSYDDGSYGASEEPAYDETGGQGDYSEPAEPVYNEEGGY